MTMDEFTSLVKSLMSSLDIVSICLSNKSYQDNTKLLLEHNSDDSFDSVDGTWTKLSIDDTVMCMVISLNLCEHLFSKFLFTTSSSPSSSPSSLRDLYMQLSYDIHSLKSFIFKTHKNMNKKTSTDSGNSISSIINNNYNDTNNNSSSSSSCCELTILSTRVCTALDDISVLISIRIILIDILTLLNTSTSNSTTTTTNNNNNNTDNNNNIPNISTILTSLDKYTNENMIKSTNVDTRYVVIAGILEGKAIMSFLKARESLLSYNYPQFITMNEQIRQHIIQIENYNGANVNDSSMLKWLRKSHLWLKEMMTIVFFKIRNSQLTKKFSTKNDDIAIVNNVMNSISKYINNGLVHVGMYSKDKISKAFVCPPRTLWISSDSSSSSSSTTVLTSEDESNNNDNVWHEIFSQMSKKGKVSEVSMKTLLLPQHLVTQIEADNNDQIYVDYILSNHGTDVTDSVGGIGNNSPNTRFNQSIIALTSLSDAFSQKYYMIKVAVQNYDNNNLINVDEFKTNVISNISTLKDMFSGFNLYDFN